jgi:hypothetical protein
MKGPKRKAARDEFPNGLAAKRRKISNVTTRVSIAPIAAHERVELPTTGTNLRPEPEWRTTDN